MYWFLLIIAGLFEVAFTFCLGKGKDECFLFLLLHQAVAAADSDHENGKRDG